MSRWDDQFTDFTEQLSFEWFVVGFILFVLLLSGPVGGVDFTGEPTTLGSGNATVTVVEPSTDRLTVSEGRFGTNVTYVRIPDAVLNVEQFRGQPKVVYLVTVPELDVDRQSRRYIESTGRLRLPVEDRALLTRPESGSYQGRLVVRVQGFGYDRVVYNRSVEVMVE